VIIHNNKDVNGDPIKSGSGLGYDGLNGGALIVEFDFQNNTNKNEPSYPHISV